MEIDQDIFPGQAFKEKNNWTRDKLDTIDI